MGKQNANSTGTSTTPKSRTSTTSNSSPDLNAAIVSLTGEIGSLRTRIQSLEEKQRPELDFFKSSKRLNNFTMLVFILLPIIQLGAVVILLNIFLPDQTFTEILNYTIGLIGIATIFEIFYVPLKIHHLEKRIEDLEK